jgi:hypothetical protein
VCCLAKGQHPRAMHAPLAPQQQEHHQQGCSCTHPAHIREAYHWLMRCMAATYPQALLRPTQYQEYHCRCQPQYHHSREARCTVWPTSTAGSVSSSTAASCASSSSSSSHCAGLCVGYDKHAVQPLCLGAGRGCVGGVGPRTVPCCGGVEGRFGTAADPPAISVSTGRCTIRGARSFGAGGRGAPLMLMAPLHLLHLWLMLLAPSASRDCFVSSLMTRIGACPLGLWLNFTKLDCELFLGRA